ncbi:MAG: DNA mismatch repair endonuclease MutL [Bacteroidetes bacterium]|nr:MAG: DNA mismatch repair endonuclease MutL [Bacteroidota bacterium]
MSEIIHVLSDAVANQIAAGEVIQRPASVVKELMENAVDAKATTIRVIIKDAGKTLIQIIDNGCGMSDLDAERCFERHATSKISKAEDLFSIRTSGFRGEALASMAAVAEVSLKTCQKGNELGIQIRIAGSKLESKDPVQAPVGSNFQVRNLFFNIPARRKFLKSDQTELRHIINEFNHVALTHPEIEFSMIHNQSDIFQLPISNLRQRIIGVFGKSTNSYLIPLESETTLITISGFIGKPEHARRTYGEQFFFVNNRYIKHSYFHKAVMSGYDQILAADHIPSYFIYFTIDPSHIDVNIHPSKTEVKFEDERAIWQILLASVKKAIGKNNLSPSLDFDTEGVIDIPVLSKDTEIRQPAIDTNPAYNPFAGEDSYEREKRSTPYQDERFEGWEQLFEPMQGIEVNTQKNLQIRNKYILSPVKSGVMLIDQRRAHERILYERMLKALEEHQPLAQQSLFPESIRLNAADYQVCLEMMAPMEQLGFDIRDFGNNSIVVHGFPAEMKPTNASETIELMIEQYKTMQGLDDTQYAERVSRAAAKASAVQYGKQLNEIEMQELIDQLFACANPNHTPSGSLIARIMDLQELDAHFKD